MIVPPTPLVTSGDELVVQALVPSGQAVDPAAAAGGEGPVVEADTG
ncbi:MAG: hypothetical protein WKF86_11135 [Acidimicrobiales bacterium]